MMHARSSLDLSTTFIALSALNWDIDSPIAPSVPAWRKSRRVRPSQVVVEPLPENLNMASGG